MKKVVKFGGSSLASAEQFQKVGDIIRADKSRCFVVPSAPGKRYSADTKVTDMLYKCYEMASKGEDITEFFSAFFQRKVRSVRISAFRLGTIPLSDASISIFWMPSIRRRPSAVR